MRNFDPDSPLNILAGWVLLGISEMWEEVKRRYGFKHTGGVFI